MRVIAYMIAIISIGMVIAASTVAFTTLLLEAERAGFQQASATLSTTLVGDYLVTHYVSYCDGTLANNDININPFYMVSMYDYDGNGISEYEDRLNEINNGVFNIYSGDVSMILSNPDKDQVNSVTQSITYSATSTYGEWEDKHAGIHTFRANMLARHIATWTSVYAKECVAFVTQFLNNLWSYFISAPDEGDMPTLPTVYGVELAPFDMTPATTKNAEIHYFIPVIITESNTTATQATAAQLHTIEITARVTFYDIKQYFDAVTEHWEE